MRIAAIVLAAGAGRRMGGPKALLPVGGRSFLAHLCALYLGSRIAATIAVLGAEAERVEREARLPGGVHVVRNDDWERGMLTSVWRGLAAAKALGAAAVLLHPVDHPLVEAATVDAVSRALESGAVLAVPSFGGRRGHPGGFAAALFPELLAAPVDQGARAVLAANRERITYVPGTASCVAGVNTPGDYENLVGALGSAPLRGSD